MSRGRTILLVDDNVDDVDLTLRAFGRCSTPNKIVVVRDGAEALDYLFCTGAWSERDPHDVPEVVLLDLNMPRIGGLEVLRRLRADPRTKRLPVVVLTSSGEDSDRLGSYDLGANSFVRKPVDFAEFVTTAEDLGRYWLALNEPAK